MTTSTNSMNEKPLSLKEIIGRGYKKFWQSTKRYRVVKGSRASKKSTTTALNLIFRMTQYPEANTLVIRQTMSTLKDSCYAQLKWAINRLGLNDYWKSTVNPLQLEYLPTGQKILFRGLDDPLKITSITVDKGVLCWLWVEEAYEIQEEDFNRIDESLRGKLPPGYFLQCTLTFNPWDSSSWLKARFFDTPRENVLAMTTNYTCNEWLSEQDHEMFEDMKKHDPERYKVAGLGEWGIAAGQYFSQWRESLHVVKPFAIPEGWLKFRSMDWGSARPYAVLWWAIDFDGNMYCYRELYGWGGKPNVGTNETAKQVGERIVKLETKEEKVHYGVLDNACWTSTGVTGPTIAEELNKVLYSHKIVTFGKSSKGRMEGANAFRERLIGNKQQDGTFKPAIYFFSNCIHTIRTIPMLAHDARNPELPDTQAEDHCFIAGTMITTARGNVPIEDVTLDDYVLTRKGYKRVLASNKTRENAEVMTAYFSDGTTLTATKNHPIFVKGKGFIPIDTAPYGGIIYSIKEMVKSCQENKQKQQLAAKKNVISVVCLQTEKEKHDVYNLTVDEIHEYFANGILVHNCYDAVAYACLSRPWKPSKPVDGYNRQKDAWRDRHEKPRSAWTY